MADHAGLPDYLNSNDRLLVYADFLSQYPVARGIEMDLGRSFVVSPEARARFDYVIGSVHSLMAGGERRTFRYFLDWIHGKKPDYDPREQFGDVESLLQGHLGLLRREFSTQKYDILGHPSLLPPLALGEPEAVFPEWWEDALVALAAEYGVALEISNRWRTPYRRLMEKAVRNGLRFSAGSDGHEPGQTCLLDYPRNLLEEFGVGPDRVFDIQREWAEVR